MTTINYRGRKIRLGKHMLAALEYALKQPARWHDIGRDKAGRIAVRRLEAAGLEIREYSNQFRVISGN